MSNQRSLSNGCVCESGCEACGKLAEAFEAMREAMAAPDLLATLEQAPEPPIYTMPEDYLTMTHEQASDLACFVNEWREWYRQNRAAALEKVKL